MKLSLQILCILFFCSFGLLVSCGVPTLENPGIDGNKKLTELSDSEIATLATLSQNETSNLDFCSMTASLAASAEGTTSKAKCEEMAQKCKEESKTKPNSTNPTTQISKEQFAQCPTATVEMLTKCQMAMIQSTKDMTQKYNCSSISSNPETSQTAMLSMMMTLLLGPCGELQKNCKTSSTNTNTNP